MLPCRSEYAILRRASRYVVVAARNERLRIDKRWFHFHINAGALDVVQNAAPNALQIAAICYVAAALGWRVQFVD